jgi:hypothetical protein
MIISPLEARAGFDAGLDDVIMPIRSRVVKWIVVTSVICLVNIDSESCPNLIAL